jgi:DNA-directed RNA polymerase specialized sigma24 family protein
VVDRYYDIPPHVRDERILKLRRLGWTYAKIGRAVGMDESGVRRALERIRERGFGQGATRN